jgi:hypothetical protein
MMLPSARMACFTVHPGCIRGQKKGQVGLVSALLEPRSRFFHLEWRAQSAVGRLLPVTPLGQPASLPVSSAQRLSLQQPSFTMRR